MVVRGEHLWWLGVSIYTRDDFGIRVEEVCEWRWGVWRWSHGVEVGGTIVRVEVGGLMVWRWGVSWCGGGGLMV